MTPNYTSQREKQALLEVGQTSIRPSTARILVGLFLLTILSVPLLEPFLSQGMEGAGGLRRAGPLPSALVELARRAGESRGMAADEGLIRANRHVQVAIHDFEAGLEDDSFLRRELLPPVQLFLASRFGLGNEQAYVGSDGWLFYRPDLDSVTGPGFLEPAVLTRRVRGGKAWESAPQPDPRPALRRLRDELNERGVQLLLLPTPVKPTLHPGTFAGRAAGSTPRNPSWDPFLRSMDELGIEVLDVVPLLVQERAVSGEDLYLRTDTHWTPRVMERVARELAREIALRIDLSPPDPDGFLRRSAVVEGRGDIATMLRLPEDRRLFPDQRVTISPVLSGQGDAWKTDRDAEVLLLGDSFTNVFSQAGLGWGGGAGLAEQLSFYLQRPVDRIALNAGGAHAARQALARQLAADHDRLTGTRIVVYQFADRELAIGDWKLLDP